MSSPSQRFRAWRRRWQLLAAAAVVPMLATGVAVLQQPAQAVPQRPATAAKATSTHKVTLVTGDVVTVTTMADGKQIADVDRPDDAVGGIRMQEIRGDLYVIPDEAVPLLGAGRLDRRLFDVTGLIEMGYDDAKATGVPLIATYTGKQRSAPQGGRVTRALPGIRGAAMTAEKSRSRGFWKAVAGKGSGPALGAGMDKLWLDGRVKATLQESVPLVGAPQAWAAGFDGSGVTVAVLDTGIDATHPDLAGQIDGSMSFVPGESVTDINGHGTHVASTIVGTGAASGGAYKGVAPGADLIVGKVLGGAEGSGQDSWVIAGMQWAAESGADVVSMSLGDTMPSDGTDPMSQAVDALTAQYGTLFVIAAGNAGPETISTPAAAASALTVAATDKQDQLAYFSSTGPLAGSGAMKPDIAAPGVDITAARSQHDATPDDPGMYTTMSGTSMATPHVSGAAAILAQQHPGWTATELKQHLMSTAKGLADGYSPYEVGTGRLDVAAAVTTTIDATGSLFFGNYTWPHEPTDVAVTQDLAFTNHGDAAVTLDLTLTNTTGVFTLGATTVTVPAGGKATVSVTGDPQAVNSGRLVGYVVGTDATTGQALTRTAVGLVKEDERYDLTIKLVGRDGKPAQGWVSMSMAGDWWPWGIYVDGQTVLRMPPGTYSVATQLDVAGEGPDRSGLATLVDPETVLTGPAEVVLDASKARLLQTDAPQRAEDRQRKVDFSYVDVYGVEFRSAYLVPPAYDDLYVSPTEQVSQGQFMLTTRWRKGQALLGLSAFGGLLSFETLVQPGSELADGTTDRWSAVYANEGSAADFAKIKARGKIAVVRRSDTVTAQERAAAAEAAGAKALIVVHDGVGGLMEYVGEASIPVATVHRDAGKALIALTKSGAVDLTVKQNQYTDFVYDLTREYPGQVPDRPLVYTPSQRELAKIDARYYNAGAPGENSGYRYDLTLSPTLGMHEREWHPGTRVEWVTPGQVWGESHAQNIYGELNWEVVSGVNTFSTDATTRLDWFRPAVRPGFSDAFAVENSRWQNFMTFNVQDWSSSSDVLRLGGYVNPWAATPTHLQIYQGDTLIHDNPYSTDMQWKEVPAGNLPFRAVLDAERPADVFRLSTRTHTEWTFFSDTVDADFFRPFSVQELQYQLETDLHGDIDDGVVQQIKLRSIPSNFGTIPGTVDKVTLDVSYDDGGHWQKVTLTQGADGWWTGSFTAPARAKYVSVRASAEMSSGYRIHQEIIRAYGVR
ncbi:MAG: S8 family serine peptidase [Hamadaea sp.]|nr:S8 family serine peptidase [Hamadaea sp.]